MGPLAAVAIPAGITALGQMIGGNQQNAANAKQARLNREFQERMSNTAYQRTVADMRAAGLNPALAYQQGGASSPSGATSAPQQNVLGNATTSAVAAAQAAASIQQTRALTTKTMEETRQVKQDSDFRHTFRGVEFATRLNQLMESGALAAARGQPSWIKRIIEQAEADLKLTQTGARQAAADANIKELLNRPMLKKGYEYLRGRMAPMFDGSALEKLRNEARWKTSKGGGTSW